MVRRNASNITNIVINIGEMTHDLNSERNLGAYFAKHMTMEQHVKSKFRASYGCWNFRICTIAKIGCIHTLKHSEALSISLQKLYS